MEFNKNKLMEETIDKYMNTWAMLIDTEDFVKEKYLDRIDKVIYKNLQKKLKEIQIYYWLELESKGVPLTLYRRIVICFSRLRPVFEMEQKEFAKKQQEKAERAESKKKIKRAKTKTTVKKEAAEEQKAE